MIIIINRLYYICILLLIIRVNECKHIDDKTSTDLKIIPHRFKEIIPEQIVKEEPQFIEINGKLWERGVGSCTYLATWGSLNGVEGAERGPKSGVCSTTRHCVNSPLVPCQGQCKCTGENGGTQGGTKSGSSGGSCICAKNQIENNGYKGGWSR